MSSGTGLSLDALFATRAKAFREGPDWAPEPEGTISLSYGFADPEHFPVAQIIDATAEVLAEDVNGALNYGPTYPGLVRLVVDRLKTRGVAHAAPSNVMISYGSSQILALLPQIMVDPGDVVIVEGPCFMGAVRSFKKLVQRLKRCQCVQMAWISMSSHTCLLISRSKGFAPNLSIRHRLTRIQPVR